MKLWQKLRQGIRRIVQPSYIPYIYPAIITRWVDGDTVWMDVDLGFRFHAVLDFRLYGINTPERGKPGWIEANQAVARMAPVGTPVIIQSRKAPDKYGRWLADIWVSGVHINAELVQGGFAVPYMA